MVVTSGQDFLWKHVPHGKKVSRALLNVRETFNEHSWHVVTCHDTNFRERACT